MEVDSGSTQASAIRAVRTHVMAQHINHGRRALAICGPNKGVGCSFVAANLAVALSQIGVKTLLIDADLRNPTLDSLIRPPHTPLGLSGCLRSPDQPFGASIDEGVLPNLSIIYAGQPAANAHELLGGDRFKALMNFCMREFEATIVDTPPANASTDARRIGGVVGYSLIVMAKDKTFVKDVKTLMHELKSDGCTPIGTVLNQG
jgi:receptor protein-tyrosine kinase